MTLTAPDRAATTPGQPLVDLSQPSSHDPELIARLRAEERAALEVLKQTAEDGQPADADGPEGGGRGADLGIADEDGPRRTQGKHPMTSDLGEHTVAQAWQVAQPLWFDPEIGWYPGRPEQIAELAEAIVEWAAQEQLPALIDLTGPVAERMLCQVGGVNDLEDIEDPERRDRVHVLRDIVIALRGTILVTDQSLRCRRSDRPASDSLSSGLPILPGRKSRTRRALFSSEVLKLRTLVEIDLRELAEVQPIIAVALALTGVRTMPSTKLRTLALDDPRQPTTVEVDGVWQWAARTLEFAPWEAQAMTRALTRLRSGDTPLTYRGDPPGTRGACASLDPVLGRYLRRAGVDSIHPREVAPLSIALWRPDHEIRVNHDWRAAKHIHGGKTGNLLTDLRLETEESQLKDALIDIFEKETGELVGTFPASHINDRH